MIRFLYYWVLISRPVNVLITILSVTVAGLLTKLDLNGLILAGAAFSAGLITSAGNIINDLADIETDKINQPRRLLASGKISRRNAFVYFGLSQAGGLFLALFLSLPLFLLAALVSILLVLYSLYLKRQPLSGNLLVSLCTGLAFIFGALAAGAWQAGLMPAVFSFLFHLGRELLKDVQDVPGDLSIQAKTIPIVFGTEFTLRLVRIVFMLLIISTFIPYLFSLYGQYYWLIVLPGVDLFLILVLLLTTRRQDPVFLAKINLALKADMIVGLTAIYLG